MTDHGFVHAHGSLRFDRDDEETREGILRLMNQAHVVTLTEVSREGREQIIRDLCERLNWGCITGDKGGMDDTAILWDKERFQAEHRSTKTVSNVTYDAPGGSAPAASFAVLKDLKAKKILLVSGLHLASSVESAGKFKANSPRVRSWNAAQRGWRKAWNDYAKRYGVHGVLIAADWNVNIRSAFFRFRFKEIQPGMKLVLDFKNLPAKGTLGKRIIDFSFYKGKLKVVKKPIVLSQDASSDHRPYKETLGWRM